MFVLDRFHAKLLYLIQVAPRKNQTLKLQEDNIKIILEQAKTKNDEANIDQYVILQNEHAIGLSDSCQDENE